MPRILILGFFVKKILTFFLNGIVGTYHTQRIGIDGICRYNQLAIKSIRKKYAKKIEIEVLIPQSLFIIFII